MLFTPALNIPLMRLEMGMNMFTILVNIINLYKP